MYSTKATVLALIAAVPLALSSPILETRQNGVTCQTSSGSPLTTDVTDVINQLRGQGGNCPQTNGEASGKPFHLHPHLHREKKQNNANEGVLRHLDCTTLVSHNSAAISVCGGVDDDSSATSCADIAAFANQIQQTCNSGNPVRAGGMYTVSPSKRVEVIHS